MEDFCKYLGINRTLSLICCTLWIFSPAVSLTEGNAILGVVGSKVILRCNNEANGTLIQLTWKMNGVSLLSFIPQVPLHVSPAARRLNINMSESQLYAVVIESVQRSHTGNYTCEINTDARVQEHKWELTVTEREEPGYLDKLAIAVAAIVPCVCCLFLILALAILQRLRKQCAEDHSPNAEMQEQEREEDIYENCLETDASRQWGYHQPRHCKPRTH